MQKWNIRYNKNGPKAKMNINKDFSGTWHCNNIYSTKKAGTFFTTECVTGEQLMLACSRTKIVQLALNRCHYHQSYKLRLQNNFLCQEREGMHLFISVNLAIQGY